VKKEKIFSFLLFTALLVLSSFLLINNLGNTPLKSWDEAWYAEISRNIIKSNNWFLLQWNGLPYFDHPPLGFWAVALSFKIFGVSEFSTRLPSAISGIFSLILIYLIGKELFNKTVGLGASLILLSTPWFWLRSREGDLDIILVLFVLLSIYLTLKAKSNLKILPFLALSIAFMLLTKTMIGLGIFPLIAYLYYKPQKFNFKFIFISLIILILTVGSWYFINFIHYGLPFIDRNIFITGMKMASYKAIGKSVGKFMLFPKPNLYNLHMGILLWYKPFIVSLFGSLLFLKSKSFRAILLWNITYLLLFFTSDKTQLWHFIIIYPAIALLVSAFVFNLSKIVLNILKIQIGKLYRFQIKSGMTVVLASVITIVFISWTGNRIVKGLYKDIVKNQPINDEIILSKAAKENEGTIYIDDDYWMTAVFYSERIVYSIPLSSETPLKNIPMVFENSSKPFLILTKKWILDRDKINPQNYEILKQVGDRVLIKSKI